MGSLSDFRLDHRPWIISQCRHTEKLASRHIRLGRQDDEPMVLPGVAFLPRTEVPKCGPDRFTEQFRREGDGVVLQAATFPVQASRQPAQVLGTVVDAYVRSRGTEGRGY